MNLKRQHVLKHTLRLAASTHHAYTLRLATSTHLAQFAGGEWKHDLGSLAQRIPPAPPPQRSLLRRWSIFITQVSQIIDNPQHRFNDYNDLWMSNYTIRRYAPESLSTINSHLWTSKEEPLA